MQIIQLNDRNRWIASVAAIALLAGVGGILVGRSMSDEQTTEATAEEGEEHGPEGFVPMAPERLAANGIATEKLVLGSLTSEVLAQATVKAPPEGQALLTARADGERADVPIGGADAVQGIDRLRRAARTRRVEDPDRGRATGQERGEGEVRARIAVRSGPVSE